MAILALVRKDLSRAVADRRALAVNVGMPLVLSFIMGLSFGGGLFGGSGPAAIRVAFVAPDLPAGLRDGLQEGLEDGAFLDVAWADSAEADRRVRNGEAAAAVVLPAGAVRRFVRGDSVTIAVWQDPASPLYAGIVEQIVRRGLLRYQAGEAAYLALWPEDAEGAGAFGEAAWEALAADDFPDLWRRLRRLGDDPRHGSLLDGFLRALDRNVALVEALQQETVVLQAADKAPAAAAVSGGTGNIYDSILPGFAVFFLMFTVAASARDLHRERAAGTLQRQLLAPVTAVDLVVGKWLAAGIQGALQLAVLFGAGALLFGVNLGPDAWSLAVTVAAGSAAGASFFLLMALLTPTEKIMDNVSTVVILIAAMLGGNLMPMDMMPPWARQVGGLFFNSWFGRGLDAVMARERGVLESPLPVLVLAATAAALLAASLLVLARRRGRGGLA